MPLSRRLMLIAFLAALSAGCANIQQSNKQVPNQVARNATEAEPSKSTTHQDAIRQLADYLGLKRGQHWQYLGEGNEFASFTADVTHVNGDLYQIEENNGGTLLARVIALRSDGAFEILTQGEHQPKQSLLAGLQDDQKKSPGKKLIPWPISAGATWTQPDGSKATVAATSTMRTVPFGELNEVLHIRVESPIRTPAPAQSQPPPGSASTQNGEQSFVDYYYARGIGLIERNFTMGETHVTSKLQRATLTLD